MVNMKKIFSVIIIINLLVFIPYRANAMTVGEIVTYPFKLIAKPFSWIKHGSVKKVDEYKVEVTYKLEFEGKPLIIKKAIQCDIYEGKQRSVHDGIKYPYRKAVRLNTHINHYLENGEILVFKNPVICKVDKAYTAKTWKEKSALRGTVFKADITKLPNKTKSFEPLDEGYIPSIAIVKNKNNVEFIERVISPKYYEKQDAEIKFKSITLKNGSSLEPDKEDSRFSWIDDSDSFEHLRKDNGLYVAFGVFKFPKQIWSKIPKINEFIDKIEKSNPKKGFFAMSRRLTKVDGVDLKEIFKEIYDVNILGIYDIEQIGSYSDIHGIGKANHIRYKGKKLETGNFKSIIAVKNHNYRDYYHPFTFDENGNVWNISNNNKGKLIVQKIQNPKLIKLGTKVILKDSEYRWDARFKLFNEIFVKNEETGAMIFYDVKSKELIYPHANLAINLK